MGDAKITSTPYNDVFWTLLNVKNEGIEEGIEKGIEGTVSILKELGIPPQTILIRIQEQYHLSPEVSKKYL